jgi:hypothetical protein
MIDSPARAYALGIGAALLIGGIVGFFYEGSFSSGPHGATDSVFGILDVNGWHNVVHIASGALGLLLARTYAGARAYALLLGCVYTVVAVAGFALGDGHFLLSLVPVNSEDNFLHLGISLLGFIAFAATPAEPMPSTI